MFGIADHQARKGILLLFAYFFIWLIYAAFTEFVSFDAYWHMRMGEDLLYRSLAPGIDHYSYTYLNEPVTNTPVIFQSILAVFSSNFGVPAGLKFLRLIVMCLFLAAIFLFYRSIRANWVIIALTLPYIVLFYLFRFMHVRPEMFGNLFIVVALILCIKTRTDYSHKNLALIAGFMLFWVNYHIAILGYVIFFGLFVDKAIDLLRKVEDRQLWSSWLVWGAVIFLLGFANPNLTHTLFDTLKFSDEWALINEFKATHEILSNNSLLTGFWLVCIYVVIALARQYHFGLAIVCAIFAFQSWDSLRFLTISGVVVICLTAYALAETDFEQLFASVKKSIRVLLITTGFGIGLAGVALSSVKAFETQQLNNSDEYPASIVSHLLENHPGGGNIFNRAREGGFLLYHLAPEFKVYIDGRSNILYPLDFIKRHLDLYYYTGVGGSLADELQRHDVDFAIYPIEFGQLLISDKSHDLSLELVTDRFVLFSTAPDGFPVSGSLLYFPMCWHDQLADAIEPELANAEQVLPQSSQLLPLLNSLKEIIAKGDQENFIDMTLASPPANDYHRRFLAYLAADSHRYPEAYGLFETIEYKETLDLLMMALAQSRMSNDALASELLSFVLSDTWSRQNPFALSELEKIGLVSLFGHLKPYFRFPQDITSLVEGHRQSLLGKYPESFFALDRFDPAIICPSILPETVPAQTGVSLEQ